jgi:hypothetical protein
VILIEDHRVERCGFDEELGIRLVPGSPGAGFEPTPEIEGDRRHSPIPKTNPESSALTSQQSSFSLTSNDHGQINALAMLCGDISIMYIIICVLGLVNSINIFTNANL